MTSMEAESNPHVPSTDNLYSFLGVGDVPLRASLYTFWNQRAVVDHLRRRLPLTLRPAGSIRHNIVLGAPGF